MHVSFFVWALLKESAYALESTQVQNIRMDYTKNYRNIGKRVHISIRTRKRTGKLEFPNHVISSQCPENTSSHIVMSRNIS